MENKIKLVIIERSKDATTLLQRRMKDSSVIELTASFIYHPSFLEEVASFKTDIILLNINLPCDITAFIKDLKKKTPAKIILSCEFIQPDLIFNCLIAGASGYVEKYATQTTLENGIKDCFENLSFLPLNIITLFYEQYVKHETNEIRKKIFSLLSGGFHLKEVVYETGLTEREIKQHIFLSVHR
ncbi:MAG: hypothetical protein ABI723_00655 [Bacteroidia bacterium]